MKSFTYPQKKWVLTGALLAALGLNVSFNNHKYGIAHSADFSSVIEPTKLHTPNGTISVVYIPEGESRVRAIIPKKTTHGDFCASNSCGVDDVILSVKNKSDIDELNVALLKALEENKDLGKTTRSETQRGVEGIDTQEQRVEDETDKKLAQILKRCERNDAEIEQLTCLTEELGNFMQRNAKKKVSQSQVNAFVRNEVLGRVAGTIETTRRTYVLAKKSQVDMDARQQYWQSELQYEEASQMRRDSLLAVEALLSKTPKNYESIRKLLVSAETTLVREEARSIQQLRRDAEAQQASNPVGATSMKWDAQFRTEDLQTLQKGFTDINRVAFDYAQRSGNMDGILQSTYSNYFTNSTMPIINGMIMNPTTYVIPVVQEDGSVIPTPVTGSPILAPRINNPGRGVTPIQQPSIIRVTPDGRMVQVQGESQQQGTIQIAADGSLVQVGTTQTTVQPNNIQFGEVSPASQEALRLRSQLRGN